MNRHLYSHPTAAERSEISRRLVIIALTAIANDLEIFRPGARLPKCAILGESDSRIDPDDMLDPLVGWLSVQGGDDNIMDRKGGCDLSGAKLYKVSMPGIDVTQAIMPSYTAPFIVLDWESRRRSVETEAKKWVTSDNAELRNSSIYILSCIKEDKKQLKYHGGAAKGRARYCHELDPDGSYTAQGISIRGQIYQDAGIL